MTASRQTQWFGECLACGRHHVFTRALKSDTCIDCGGVLVAVGGVLDGKRVDVPLTDDERQALRAIKRTP